MHLLITICARGGSKGIPGKNIRPVNGTPLIVYSIRHALAYAKKTGADIELSTDSEDIKKVAAEAGLKTDYVRPPELSTDLIGKLDTIQHVVFDTEKRKGKRYDYILDLDVTSPLRTIEDLEKAFAMMEGNPKARNLFSVSFPKHNPYFDMVETTDEGFVELVKKPASQMVARQQGPRVYEVNASFYFYRRAFFDEEPLIIIRNTLAYETPHMCFELDEMLEFYLLDYLLREKKLDFDFR
jgi:CMP-N-acetylneuraminic acid synthetase